VELEPLPVGHQAGLLEGQIDPGDLAQTKLGGPLLEQILGPPRSTIVPDLECQRPVVEVAGLTQRFTEAQGAVPLALPVVERRGAREQQLPVAEELGRVDGAIEVDVVLFERRVDALLHGEGVDNRLERRARRVQALDGEVVEYGLLRQRQPLGIGEAAVREHRRVE
jgi:hypothetical protein